ncbi:MAG TPA: hypothetical protein VGM51_07895 [Armatimonadota bacterium]|jgi:hypothetical protein
MNRDKAQPQLDALAEMPEWTDDDWANAKPNRFADRFGDAVSVVLLDPEVAEVFTTPAAVNNALRALIEAMPAPAKRKRAAKTSGGRQTTAAPK